MMNCEVGGEDKVCEVDQNTTLGYISPFWEGDEIRGVFEGTADVFDDTPIIFDELFTPNITLEESPAGTVTPDDITFPDTHGRTNNPNLENGNISLSATDLEEVFPIARELDVSGTSCGNMSGLSDEEDPYYILKNLKEKNSERPVIAHLNINSISSKFEPLTSMIKDNIDFLLVTESKLDETFPHGQFRIEGYARPFRLDRTRNGGGLIIFVRDDLTCRELKPRVLFPDLECTFLELRVRQTKWLILVGYNPHKEKISEFLEKISKELDKLVPKYENLLMLGDWNSSVNEHSMREFCEMYALENLIKENTCFKSTENPSAIDIILTNKKNSFQNSTVVETGLSDFHKMTVTVMKKFFKKKDPIIIKYHDRKNFNAVNFREDIRSQISCRDEIRVAKNFKPFLLCLIINLT